MATNVNAKSRTNVNNGVVISEVEETVQEQEVQEVQETEETNNSNAGGYKTFKQVVKELMAGENNKRVNNIRVRSAKVTEMDNYARVSLTLDNAVDAYISDDNGNYERGTNTVIFASTYSIGSLLKESDETAWCANQLLQNTKGFEVILAGAKIDIIQEEVSNDQMYINPFSNNNSEGVFLGHDTIINHVVKITITKQAQKMLDMMAMKMMMGDMFI